MQVGDTIFLVRYGRYGAAPSAAKQAVVTKVTPTGQIVDGDGNRWKPNHMPGEYDGVGHNNWDIVTEEAFQQAQREMAQAAIGMELNNLNWRKYSLDTLRQVKALIEAERGRQ